MERPLDAQGRPIVEDRKPFDTDYYKATRELATILMVSNEPIQVSRKYTASKTELVNVATPFFPVLVLRGDTFDIASKIVNMMGSHQVRALLHKLKLQAINSKPSTLQGRP